MVYLRLLALKQSDGARLDPRFALLAAVQAQGSIAQLDTTGLSWTSTACPHCHLPYFHGYKAFVL